MKFKDFELKSDNHFVAMQYYGLILNRTFLVLLAKDLLIGIKVNGLVSAETRGEILANEIVKPMVIKGDLNDPHSYMKSKYLDKVKDCDLTNNSILTKDKSNFILNVKT